MKILIAVPALDTMPVQTAYCMLSLKRDCPSKFSFIVRASCQDARNMLAAEAVNTGADRVLWIDSDMAFEQHGSGNGKQQRRCDRYFCWHCHDHRHN